MMSELTVTADRLRQVREAQALFLDLWALEEITSRMRLLDRIACDLNRLAGGDPVSERSLETGFIGDSDESGRWSLHRRGFVDD